MAMLAEPRRRKNYVLTPRGKPLYEDDSRYGSKMLQKMGWSKGKGLGAKESGETDFVRVNFKCDAGGLGFENRDDQWTQHEDGFNGLLQSLNAQNGDATADAQIGDNEADEDGDEGFQTVGFGFKSEKKKDKKKTKVVLSGESLEEKSKKSKARVHYKKFTRGKDLSQYSEKDLANIFGKKELDIDEHKEADGKNENQQKFQDKSISITDYFKQKLEKRKGSLKIPTNDVVPVVSNAQTEGVQVPKESACTISDYFKRKMDERKSKRKGHNDGMTEGTADNKHPFSETHAEEPVQKKRKKDKKSAKDIQEEALPETYFPVASEKRKKKRKIDVEIVQENFDDCNLQLKNNAESRLPRQTEDDITETSHKESQNTKISAPQNNINEVADNTASSSTPLANKDLNFDVSVKLIENTNTKYTKQLVPPTELENTLDSFEVYTISSFVAEKFRRTEIDSFKGSNLIHLNGYPYDKDMKLNIVKNFKDEKRILDFWEGSLNKYKGSTQKKEHVSSEVSNTKAKKRPFNRSTHKRKSAFKLGI